MTRIKLKPSDTRRVRITPSRSRSVDSELARTRLGAESFATVAHGGSPLSLAALRTELVGSLRSKGGRPALEGADRRQKIPMSDQDWQSLETIAAGISKEGVAITAGQLASRLLSRSIEELQAKLRAEYPPAPADSGSLRVSDTVASAPVTQKRRGTKKQSMTGSIASNLHVGSRSEMLADYFFGTFGPVTPVRGHDDYGLDLYCALAARVGQRSFARDYFSVQVKSTHDAWVFDDQESVRWLVEQSNPILLCVVNKQAAIVEVFHTFGRFVVPPWQLPSRLVLKPGGGARGKFCSWNVTGEIDLSAPILRASVTDFYDSVKQERFREVLTSWLEQERMNLDFRRMGIFRYRMPTEYSTNEVAINRMSESGFYPPRAEAVSQGVRMLAEATDCLGDQLRFLNDFGTAARATLLLDRLRTTYPAAFAGDVFSNERAKGVLVSAMTAMLGSTRESPAAVLDAVQKEIDEMPRMAIGREKALAASNDPFQLFSFQKGPGK